jgi:hypothetical protein
LYKNLRGVVPLAIAGVGCHMDKRHKPLILCGSIQSLLAAIMDAVGEFRRPVASLAGPDASRHVATTTSGEVR